MLNAAADASAIAHILAAIPALPVGALIARFSEYGDSDHKFDLIGRAVVQSRPGHTVWFDSNEDLFLLTSEETARRHAARWTA